MVQLHGMRHHEDIRSVSEIGPADWSTLLKHADAIGFFGPSRAGADGPSDRIFHLAIAAGNRSRELAMNDPFERPKLANLIKLTRLAMRDRQVLSPDSLDDLQFVTLAAAWLDAQLANPGDDPSR